MDKRLSTAEVYRAVRQTDWFRALVPMEGLLAWPIPRVRSVAGKPHVYVEMLAFGSSEVDGKTMLSDPFCSLVVDPTTVRLVSYVDYRYESPAPAVSSERSIRRFPHPQIAAMSKADYVALRGRVFELYDQLFDLIEAGATPSPDFVLTFRRELGRVVEPALLPYLREVGKKFAAQFLDSEDMATTEGDAR